MHLEASSHGVSETAKRCHSEADIIYQNMSMLWLLLRVGDVMNKDTEQKIGGNS